MGITAICKLKRNKVCDSLYLVVPLLYKNLKVGMLVMIEQVLIEHIQFGLKALALQSKKFLDFILLSRQNFRLGIC